MKNKILSILFLTIFSLGVFSQNTKFASPFSSNMVLQRNASVKIWGSELPNTQINITTSWDNQITTTTSDSAGKWSVFVNTPEGSESSYNVKLEGSSTITLQNVLIGEVWVCSGQSNMAMTFGYPENPPGTGDAIAASATDDKIRFLRVGQLASTEEQDEFSATWGLLTGNNAKYQSIVGYFYAKKLRAELGVPIGLINNAYGASNIEAWMDEVTLGTFDFVTVSDVFLDPKQKTPGVCYNAAVHPLLGYGIKGVIWYQGEANKTRPDEYAQLLPAMVNSWRQKWDIGDFPFYYVQIVPFKSFESSNLEFWNMMKEAYYEIPNSGVVVTLDKPSCDQIHPPEKQYIGDRLALWALSQDYGFDSIVPSGPLCTSAQRIDSTLKVHFDFAETGLVAVPSGLTGFEIAGANKVYYTAQATISYDNTLILSSTSVTEPKYARYGNGACANISASLFNGVGLPASAFICEDTLNTGTSEVSISPMSAYIELSENLELQVTTANPSVNWETSDTSIAIVDENGIVTAVGYGTTNITVTTTDGNYRAACLVTVPVHVTGISVEPINVSISPADMAQLKAIYAPSDATIKSVIWESDNDSVATVDIYGKITAVANGFATIKAIADDGSFEATCAVEVTATPNVALNKPIQFSTHQVPNDNLVDGNTNDSSRWSANVFPQWAKIDLGTDYDISKFELFPYQGRDYQYIIEVSSDGSTYATAIDRSNNTTGESIISDTVEATGRYVKITVSGAASYAGSMVDINELKVYGVLPTIYVEEVSVEPTTVYLKPNEVTQLTAIITPENAYNTDVVWSSDNTSTATVDVNGLIKGIADGTTTITATTVDGNFTATCSVLVSSVPNIAKNKPHTASVVFNPSDNLLDDDLSTRWSAQGYPQWVVIDLEENYDISRFEVYPYMKRDYKYIIEVSSDGISYTTVIDQRSNTKSNDVLTDEASTTGRYVKITISGAATYSGGWVALNEFMVYGVLHETTVSVTDVSINQTTVSLEQAETKQLTATITPTNATNNSVTWSSGNNSIATVDTNGLVTAITEGNATITVTTNDGSFTADCEVTVTNSVSGVKSKVTTNSISIFPNPTNSILNIVIEEYENTVANIVDITGRLLISEQLNATKNSISLSSLKQGIYMLYLKDGNKMVHYQKIILSN